MSEGPSIPNLVIPVEKVPPAAFQAIYHNLTRKTETLSRGYTGSFKIALNDLDDLYRQIEQSVTQYQLKGKRCEVSINLSNGEVQTYSSFERFSMMNFNSFPHRTVSIAFEYDFLVVLPSDIEGVDDISQRYKIKVMMRSEEEEMGDLVVTGGRFVKEIRVTPVRMTASVEYSDYAVARHFQSLVHDWIERVRFSDEHVLSKTIAKWMKRLGAYSIFGLIGGSIIGAVFFEPPAYASIVTPMRYVAVLIFTTTISVLVGVWFWDKIEEIVTLLSPRTFILLTHGDSEEQKKVLERRRKAKSRLAFVLTGIIVAIVISVLANYISAYLIADLHNAA